MKWRKDMKKRILAVLFALALMFATVAACADEAPAAPADEPAGEKTFKAMFVTQAMSNQSQAFSWKEFQRLAPEYGFEMTVGAGENEPVVEYDYILQAIAEGYDAIFVNPSDANGILPAMRQAKEAGLIVGFFSTIPEDESNFDVAHFAAGSDDVLGGIDAGKFVSSLFPNGANFVEVGGQAGHQAATDRHNGFREGINANINELGSQFAPTGWNTHEALSIMEDFLVRFGEDIDVVWCHWDAGAAGVIEAVEAAGFKASSVPGEGIFIIGVDGSRDGYAQVRAGTQALSVGQSFTNMAAESLRLARILLEGGSLDKFVHYIPMDMVTIENVNVLPEPDW